MSKELLEAYEALEKVKKGFMPTPEERKLISMITTLKVWSEAKDV
jgi:hypothetical protein